MPTIRHHFLVLGLVVTAVGATAQRVSDSWSADLLENLLGAPPAVSGSAGAGQEQKSADTLQQDGMVVRVYQLRHQHVGNPELENKLSILEKLLPLGSVLKRDAQGDTLSLLTTSASHQAVISYLGAIDLPPAPPTREIPAEVQQALTQLLATNKEAAKLFEHIGALRADVSHQLSDMDKRNTSRMRLFGIAGGAIVVLFLCLLLFFRRKSPPVPAAKEEFSLALPFEQQSQLIIEQVNANNLAQREEFKTFLVSVAQKLASDREQIQAGQLALAELKLQLGNMAHENDRVLQRASNMLSTAVQQFDEKSQILQTEQQRVAGIAKVLQETVDELDQTRDRLREEEMANMQLRLDLEHERAKHAMLTILLEDGKMPLVGDIAAPLAATSQSDPVVEACDDNKAGVPEVQAEQPEVLAPPPPTQEAAPVKPKSGFRFLPPDAPEFSQETEV